MSEGQPLRSLSALLRKAAVDAGFDLEPEQDGTWWRLRASGAPGVAWVRPMLGGAGAWLAIPLVSQFPPAMPSPGVGNGGAWVATEPRPTLPPGAGGETMCTSPEALHLVLRDVHRQRLATPAQRLGEWQSRVQAESRQDLGGGEITAPLTTEAVAEIRRRVGQDLFRDALLDYWEGQCAVSGLAVPDLLRASHAKPWAVATDTERLDVHNGLLLAVHLDAVFDRGLLTFDEVGQGILSGHLTPDARAILGLAAGAPSLRRLHPAHQPYLTYHRTHVFRP